MVKQYALCYVTFTTIKKNLFERAMWSWTCYLTRVLFFYKVPPPYFLPSRLLWCEMRWWLESIWQHQAHGRWSLFEVLGGWTSKWKDSGDPRGKKRPVRRFWRAGMLKAEEAWGKIPEPLSRGSAPQQATLEVMVRRFQPRWSSVPPGRTLCSRSSTAKQLADCRGTGNQGAGKDSCGQCF